MAKCDIVVSSVPDNPHLGSINQTYHTEGYCRTHRMNLGPVFTEFPDSEGNPMCPVGRVEKAVEDGVATLTDLMTALEAAARSRANS